MTTGAALFLQSGVGSAGGVVVRTRWLSVQGGANLNTFIPEVYNYGPQPDAVQPCLDNTP